jgi:cellulose synthase/poly-beta-1,6-N-acetylglucosamine synthase-like glycosyltransferase
VQGAYANQSYQLDNEPIIYAGEGRLIMEIIFISSIIIIVYSYAGYPLLILFISFFKNKKVYASDIEPKVSLLITAYNEEKDIKKKLVNSFALDYPKDKFEIVVASDGSTDTTDEIVRSYQNNDTGVSVILHRVEGRLGKTAAQNSAIKICTGDIIVFSDAASLYDPEAIRALVRNYADPEVGAVSGMYTYKNREGSSVGFATILFWKIENFIKRRQTMVRTITGCCGCIYSVRKSLYTSLPPSIISDLVEPLTILQKGYRIVFEPEALAIEETAGATEEEFNMRIRVIVRGMNGMLYVRRLFNPFHYPFESFQLISHKLLRWLIPVFAILLFISNAALVGRSMFYSCLFLCQIIFYGIAATGYFAEKKGIHKMIFYLPLYFCIVNVAAFISLIKVLRNENIVVWQTKR